MISGSTFSGKTILITGGNGFIGQHVLRMGIDHHLSLHNFTTCQEHVGQDANGVIHHAVDFLNPQTIRTKIQEIKPDGIIHLAAAGVTNRQQSQTDIFQVNVIGTQVLLETASNLKNVPPVILAGSWFEYAPQQRPLIEEDKTRSWSAYAASKIAMNNIADFYAQQIPITTLRIFSVYGIGEKLPRLIPYIIETSIRHPNDPIELTACEQIRDYVNVTDIARAFWQALTQPPNHQQLRLLNVGTGQGIRLHDFVHQVKQALEQQGIKPNIVFGAKPYRPHEAMYAVADPSRIKHELGWQATTPLEQGIRAMVLHYLNEEFH